MSLEETVSKTISDFCGNLYTGAETNHCAHFVSHYLNLQFGMNCRKLTGRNKEAANVRVHEVFAQCPQVGWLESWNGSGQVLVFVTRKTNVTLSTKTMQNVPKKHIGIYDGTHIYHYGNTLDKVVRQTVNQFKQSFQSAYGGDLGFYFGTVPGETLFDTPAPADALPGVTYEIRDKNVYARIGGGEEFFVARRVTYGTRIGLMQRATDLTGPTYRPARFVEEFGPWAYMVYAIGEGESGNRFNRINSYDRAAFTFGFFQLAAHTPKDNLILFLRRATESVDFQTYFPDLQMKNGRLHRVAGSATTDLEAEVYNPNQEEYELERLMRYLNPNEKLLDEAEIIHAAKLVALCDRSQEFCDLQVHTAIKITTGKFRDRYQHWYNLAGVSDTICTAIADIHHQGRAKRAQVKTALQSSKPVNALTKLGEDKYPERCKTLRATLKALEADGKLGKQKYEPAHGVFVPA